MLASNFEQYFEIVYADTDLLKSEAFRIRHKVYCEEMAWEPLQSNGEETDVFDDYSHHCLIRHKRSKQFVGTVRLVAPPAVRPRLPLPVEDSYVHTLSKPQLAPDSFAAGVSGEISRVCVLADFRRRKGERATPYVVNDFRMEDDEELRNYPKIGMGLYLAAVAMARLLMHSHLYIMADVRLQQSLYSLGLPFEQIGEEVNYHGSRALFYLPQQRFTFYLRKDLLPFYELIEQRLSEQIPFNPTVRFIEQNGRCANGG